MVNVLHECQSLSLLDLREQEGDSQIKVSISDQGKIKLHHAKNFQELKTNVPTSHSLE